MDVFTASSIERLQQRVQWVATLLVLLMPATLWWLGPRVVTPGLIPVPWDKLLHLLTFAMLALVAGLASRLSNAWALLPAFVVAVLVGSLDEWQQIGQPNRTADWADWTANIIGAAWGCLLLMALQGLRDRLLEFHPEQEDGL